MKTVKTSKTVFQEPCLQLRPNLVTSEAEELLLYLREHLSIVQLTIFTRDDTLKKGENCPKYRTLVIQSI